MQSLLHASFVRLTSFTDTSNCFYYHHYVIIVDQTNIFSALRAAYIDLLLAFCWFSIAIGYKLGWRGRRGTRNDAASISLTEKRLRSVWRTCHTQKIRMYVTAGYKQKKTNGKHEGLKISIQKIWKIKRCCCHVHSCTNNTRRKQYLSQFNIYEKM